MSSQDLSRRAALGRALERALGLAALATPFAAPLATPRLAHAQSASSQPNWPTRPVTLMVGFPPGGQTDFAARIVQPGIGKALGQTLVIENRGGAGGNLATEVVMRAKPDGYTLMASNSSPMAINPHTFPNMTVNPLEMVNIGLALRSAMVLCVHPSVPARNIQEFVAWVKAQKDIPDYGIASAGSLSHCTSELFRARAGLPAMQSIPYRGSGPAIQDFIAGRFPMMFDAASVVAPFVKANQIRAIMVTSENRVPAFPDAATAKEQGLDDFIVSSWIGISGPRGTPPEVVARVNAALNEALSDPTVRDRITSQGDEPGGGTPESFDKLVRSDHARWGQVVKANNITSAG
ncbi:tripartite tricarboxylate transporter family receptor [Roseomonas sp. TAS13]|uniref:Bug family tripartite tricarboxylate transporter substrate binding protein n=1 Tax=Roseomonas sp. TAS13 TaxID=1926319 RepID=UPI0009648539|nr:tripartite tricarboxylate transporter substrate binding protein [Roseomonas sp. TAS13]GAV33072.1 tripartite tricarboxylate transporter family receptor [Roseomonas sp. TAS13]